MPRVWADLNRFVSRDARGYTIPWRNAPGIGASRVCVSALRRDGALMLEHEHPVDGRGPDEHRARKVWGYPHRVWRRPLTLHTVDAGGGSVEQIECRRCGLATTRQV